MSAPRNADHSGSDSADYFSRRVSRDTPWTADLVTIDADEEETQHRSGDRATSPTPTPGISGIPGKGYWDTREAVVKGKGTWDGTGKIFELS